MAKRGEQDIEKECRNQTVILKNRPQIVGSFSVAGKKEGEGIIGKYIGKVFDDCYFGEKTHEGAEQKMFETALRGAMKDAKIEHNDIDIILAGDLLNQITSSSFAARSFDASFVGIYGACSTMALTLGVGGILVDGGYAKNVAVCAGSHFATAERQYRTPLELGNQRSPLSQWTVTGAGACVLSRGGKATARVGKQNPTPEKVTKKNIVSEILGVGAGSICITAVTLGKVIDWGVLDVNNMGAAMAPAAAMTILAHFRDTGRKPQDFDMIFTGDLGKLGEELTRKILHDNGYDLGQNYTDCGRLMFSEEQNLFQGASGCGCSAVTLNSFIISKFRRGEYKRVLFCATGALLSPVSSYQGNTIPSIAHAVVIERD